MRHCEHSSAFEKVYECPKSGGYCRRSQEMVTRRNTGSLGDIVINQSMTVSQLVSRSQDDALQAAPSCARQLRTQLCRHGIYTRGTDHSLLISQIKPNLPESSYCRMWQRRLLGIAYEYDRTHGLKVVQRYATSLPHLLTSVRGRRYGQVRPILRRDSVRS